MNFLFRLWRQRRRRRLASAAASAATSIGERFIKWYYMELNGIRAAMRCYWGPAVGTCRLLATPSLSLNHSLPPPLFLSLSLSLLLVNHLLHLELHWRHLLQRRHQHSCPHRRHCVPHQRHLHLARQRQRLAKFRPVRRQQPHLRQALAPAWSSRRGEKPSVNPYRIWVKTHQ